MPVNDFEKQVQQKMDELKFAPSAEVWTEVEKRIRKERKRRVIFWWLIPGLLLGGAAIYLLNNKGEEKIIAKQEQVQSKQKEENSNLIQPPTTITTTDNATQENIIQTNDITDKNKAAGVLPKKDRPGVDQSENAEINVIKAATKKKAKEGSTMNELAIGENQQTSVVDAATKKKEQEQIVTTTEAMTIVNDKPAENKNVTIESKDSVLSVAKEETKNVEEQKIVTEESPVSAKKKDKKKWDVGFGIQGGSSNTIVGRLFGGMMFFDASPLYSTPGSGQSTSQPVYLSTPRNGFSKGIEFFVQKSISKKLDFRGAVQYNYLSTHIRTGSRVDSSRLVNNSLSDEKSIESFYRPPSGGSADQPYTNRYHLAGLSATLSWKIIGGKKFSLNWDNSIALNQLLSTNTLHYDRDLRAYYTDFKPFRKTQLFIGTGLSVPLIRRDNFSITLNPFAQVGLRTVLKRNDGEGSHFVNAGFALKFFFPHKN